MPKPVKKKKKFIQKKYSTTYRLIPGYVNDEDDTSKVLESSEEIEARKGEQRKFGIFYDDTYNYMKHLRCLNEQATLVASAQADADFEVQSSSSRQPVFVEHFSTDVTEYDLDPDVLAALDNAPIVNITEHNDGETAADVAESEDFLDDDFIAAAGGPVPVPQNVQDDEEDELATDDDDEEDDDEDGSYLSEEDFSDDDDDTVSIQPSQRRGNMQDDIAEAQTALILKNFEEGLGFQYSSQLLEDGEMPTAEDYENLKQILKDDAGKVISWAEFLDDASEKPKIDISRYMYEDDEEEDYEWKDVPVQKPKFDCMSVLSLHSNTRNLPTDIVLPKHETKKKLQKAEGDCQESSVSGISLNQLQAEIRESRKVDKACTFRPKDETIEEKKARKKAIKDERKERRQEKKANKEVFAMEEERLKKETAALSKAVKSIKIC